MVIGDGDGSHEHFVVMQDMLPQPAPAHLWCWCCVCFVDSDFDCSNETAPFSPKWPHISAKLFSDLLLSDDGDRWTQQRKYLHSWALVGPAIAAQLFASAGDSCMQSQCPGYEYIHIPLSGEWRMATQGLECWVLGIDTIFNWFEI
jgi:hypothetical protein